MARLHVGHLLQRPARAFEAELIPRVRASGYTDLTVPHTAVFSVIDAGGTRAQVLAERSGVTKQAMSKLVDDLERKGYVERRPDPEDRRAKLVVLTDRGWAAIRCARGHIDDLEAEYARRLGRERFEQLCGLLAEIQPGDDPSRPS